MKSLKLLVWVGTIAMFVAGCGGPAGNVRVATPPGPAPAVAPVEMDTFDVGQAPEKPFREIAYMTCDGVPGEFLAVLRQFKIKARQLGADAIILDEPVSYTGQDASVTRLMYRAWAVAYQNKGATARR